MRRLEAEETEEGILDLVCGVPVLPRRHGFNFYDDNKS